LCKSPRCKLSSAAETDYDSFDIAIISCRPELKFNKLQPSRFGTRVALLDIATIGVAKDQQSFFRDE
jgi:hypothetical protein